MAAPIVATMPPGIELDGGYTLQLAALDAATGNAVAGVKVSGVVITGNDLTGGLLPGETPTLTALEPLFVPVPVGLPESNGG